MIKTIKKIDLQGNETWEEVLVCNRCKKVLEPDAFVYETKWTSWHPVRIKGCFGCGFNAESNPVRHICTNCYEEVESFLEGKDLEKKNKQKRVLSTFQERVASFKESLKNESTPALLELRQSFMCTRETADAIDMILNERNLF